MPQTPLSLDSLPFSLRAGCRFDSAAASQLQHPEPLTDSTLQLHIRDFLGNADQNRFSNPVMQIQPQQIQLQQGQP